MKMEHAWAWALQCAMPCMFKMWCLPICIYISRLFGKCTDVTHTPYPLPTAQDATLFRRTAL